MPVTTVFRNAARAGLAAALAAPAVLLGAAAAQAAWAMQPAPRPAGAIAPLFSGVSCTSATACEAVGDSQTATGHESLAEAWNGTSWTIQAVASKAHVSLSGVSCTSATACTAVGSLAASAGASAPLAERWDGTSWTVQSVPGSGESLTAVSCTSATRCMAVGVTGTGVPLADSWNGTTWTSHSLPLPSGVAGAELTSVSCRSHSSCVAVGNGSPGHVPVAYSRNGTGWTAGAVPLPAGATDGSLYGVSCSTVTSCLAGGYDDSTAGRAPLAELWNGTAWAPQPTAHLGAAVTTSGFSGMSCTRAGPCTAAGYQEKFGHESVLVERWNGTAFTDETSVLVPPHSQLSDFNAVSCPTEFGCTAAGFYVTSHRGAERLLAEQGS